LDGGACRSRTGLSCSGRHRQTAPAGASPSTRPGAQPHVHGRRPIHARPRRGSCR